MKNSKYQRSILIDEPALQVLPSLAVALGLNEAMILQQLHFLLQNEKNGRTINGSKHIYNTYAEWQRQYFPFFSELAIRRSFRKLEKLGVVKSVRAESHLYKQRKFYTIDYDKFRELEAEYFGKLNREDGGSKHSSRSDQFDRIEPCQIDRINEQRLQQRENPLTPEPEFGGNSSSTGRDDNSSNHGRRSASNSSSSERDRVPSWVTRATNHPAAEEFLALVGLTEFPILGRQGLARAFVQRCESGVIDIESIRLITAMRGVLNLPTTPDGFIKKFETVVADARDMALERIREIEKGLDTVTSTPVELMQKMAVANDHISRFKAAELFAGEMALPLEKWVYLASCIKRDIDVELWKDGLKQGVLDELANDAGIVPFLQMIGLNSDRLGIDVAEIEIARSLRSTKLNVERNTLTVLTHKIRGGHSDPRGGLVELESHQ